MSLNETILTRAGIIVRLSDGSIVWRRELARRSDFAGAAALDLAPSAPAPATGGDIVFGDDFADDFADDLDGDDDDDDDGIQGDGFGDELASELAAEIGRMRGRPLSREERRTLTGAQKKALRRARRNQGGGGGRGNAKPVGKSWGRTIVTGTATFAAAGSGSVNIRLQTDFRAYDITFTGSLAGSTITSVIFGDKLVWSSSDGADVSLFAVTGFLRGLVKGQHAGKGTDIIINCTVTGAGSVKATLVGFKPINQENCY